MGINAIEELDNLKAAGFSEEQAKGQMRLISKMIDSELATKNDLAATEATLKRDIKELDIKLESNIKELELKIAISRYITIVAIPAILVALKKLGIM